MRRSILITAVGVMASIASCKKNTEYIGPSYTIAREGFAVENNSIQVPGNHVDFASGASVSVDAKFNAPISWFLTFTGTESGAVKTVQGMSDELVSVNNRWDGSHDGLYFFKAGEKVLVELSFLGTPLVIKDTITINTVKRFGQGLDLSKASTKEGFEGTGYNFNEFTLFGVYPDPAGNEFIGNNFQRDTMNPSKGILPIQGENVMTLRGKDLNSNYFIGGLKRIIKASEYALLTSNDPNDVYLNIYLYGRGDATSRLNYSVTEKDGDIFEKQIALDFVGWKLFSIKYKDLVNVGNTGGNDMDPDNPKFYSFNLISSPAGNTVEASFDLPIITIGAPFDPHK